jgi:OFA family oxalate/formate antiporter-like MFS transporter
MIYNRWFQLGTSLVAMIMIANLQYAWTLFVKPLQAGTGWNLLDIQFAFTLFIAFQTWVQPLDGWFIDRLGPRGFITAAGLLCGLGWAGMGSATSLPMLYALYCMAGMGAAFVYSASIGSALKWFKDRRGLASGIMAAGFGGGTALFIPIISDLLATRGYQSTFVATGVAQGVVIVVMAQFMRHPPAEAAAALKAAPGSTSKAVRHFTTLEVLRTPQFYWMYVMFVLMVTGGLLVTANAGPIANSWGYTTAQLTLAATLSPLANGASRIFWGWASDKLGRESTMVLSFGLQSICLFLVVTLGQTSVVWFITGLVLVYFTWGQIYALFPATSGDYFGSRNATANYAILYTAKGTAAFIILWLGPFLFQRTGSWTMGFYVSAVMALVSALMALRLRSAGARLKAASVPPAATT